MSSTSVIEIDLGRIAHNVQVVRDRLAGGAKLCCVLKADGYGLGALRIARWLDQWGVDLLAVYTLDQAEELLSTSIQAPVLVLMPIRELPRKGAILRAIERGRVEVVVHDGQQVRLLAASARAHCGVVPVHLEVDTGMGRGGVQVHEVGTILRMIRDEPGLILRGFMTHFACSATDRAYTQAQFATFEQLVAEHRSMIGPDCLLHAASTHAVWLDERYHLDMVRIGLGWIGCGPEMIREDGSDDAEHLERPAAPSGLQSAVTWTSQVAHVKWVERGCAVGYGRTWIAPRRTRLGLVPVGYADGYPVMLSNKSRVGLRLSGAGAEYVVTVPVVGRISMDQMMVDLTDVPGSEGEVHVGTAVELLSADRSSPMHVTELARLAGLEPYVLLTGLSSRITRRYRNKIEVPQAVGGSTATGRAHRDYPAA